MLSVNNVAPVNGIHRSESYLRRELVFGRKSDELV
jgi:hypothetical protein